jgi:hypothetical protein
MATAHEQRTAGKVPRSRRRNGLFRWTAEQAYKLAELGYFDDRHVELIDGVLYEMTSNPPHAVAVGLAMKLFLSRFGGASPV